MRKFNFLWLFFVDIAIGQLSTVFLFSSIGWWDVLVTFVIVSLVTKWWLDKK